MSKRLSHKLVTLMLIVTMAAGAFGRNLNTASISVDGSERGRRTAAPPVQTASSNTELILWDNTDIDFIGNGFRSVELGGLAAGQRLTNSADDVIVPPNVQVIATNIRVCGFLSATSVQPDSFAILIYQDNSGKPGSLLLRRNMPSPMLSTYIEYFNLTPAQPIVLDSGHYWLSVVAMFKQGTNYDNCTWYWGVGASVIGIQGYGQDQTSLAMGVPYPWMRADLAGYVNCVSGWFVVFGGAVGTHHGLLANLFAPVRSGHAPLDVAILEFSIADPADPVQKWSWDLNSDQVVDSETNPAMWRYPQPGHYDITLIASNSGKSDTTFKKDYIRVFDGESSLSFDGATHYDTNAGFVKPSMDLNLTQKITVEAWIKPQGFGPYLENELSYGYGRIADKYAWSLLLHDAGDFGYAEKSVVVDLTYMDNTYTDLCTPKYSIKLNEWQHVAMTYDATLKTCRVYINGVAQTLQKFGSDIQGALWENSEQPLLIGNRYDYLRTFDGDIDEVRLWNVVRTEQEIKDNMNKPLTGAESGLVAYYPLNEGSGNTAQENTGKSPSMTIYSSLWNNGVFKGHASGVATHGSGVVENFQLGQNYPNPFNPSTTIPYTLTTAGDVRLTVYDLLGRTVAVLVNEKKPAGSFTAKWNGQDKNNFSVANGVYFYTLEISSSDQRFTSSKKLALVK